MSNRPETPQVIVALDVPASNEIGPIVDNLPDAITWYKVGLELFVSEGPAALAPLKKRGKHIFLDLKLHDIPRTVARAVTSAARHGIELLTVHAGGGRDMLAAAAEAAGDGPRLLAVTTLTSLDQADLDALGVQRDIGKHTLSLGELAVDAGIHGLVCSVHEAASFRLALGDDPILVTPGIRLRQGSGGQVLPENEHGDQKRVAAPAEAVAAGSDFLVIGRPILQAADPHAAAKKIMQQMTGGQTPC